MFKNLLVPKSEGFFLLGGRKSNGAKRSKPSFKRVIGICVLSFFVALISAAIIFNNNQNAAAASYDYINFQGKLTDAAGFGVASETKSITFCVFSASSGGSCSATPSGQLWYETKNVTTDARGLFNTQLGDTTSFGTLFTTQANNNLYLAVNVAGDGEMTPRHPVGSVPKAFNTEKLLGNTWAVPGTIGGTTPAAGYFTTLSASTSLATNSITTYSGSDISFNSKNLTSVGTIGSGAITSTGAIQGTTLTATATGNAVVLSNASGAIIAFTGAGTGQITTATDQDLALMPGGTGNVGIGVDSPNGRLHSYISNAAVTTSQYTGYFENLATNTTTDAINKYGIYITSTGDFTGSSGTATNNYGLYVNTPAGADNNYAAVFAGGNVGIGTGTPGAKLHATSSSATSGLNNIAIQGNVGTYAYNNYAGYFTASGGNSAYIVGVYASASGSSGDPQNIGVKTDVSGTSSSSVGVLVSNINARSSGFNRGIDITVSGAGSTNNYGVYTSVSGATNNYGIYSLNGSNYFGGNVGVGVTGPTGVLHLKAGTTAASTAPIKFTTGTNMTAAEAGAVEWDGTNLYITQTAGPTRKTIAYTDSALIGSLPWNNLTNPTGNMALSTMGSYTSTFTYGNATSTNNLFNLTDTASNTGTGYMLNVTTASGSTLKPFHVSAAGVEAITVLANGNVGIGTTGPSHKLSVGLLTAVSTSTPDTLNLGGTYSDTAGANLKLRLFDNGAGLLYGLGVSNLSMDFVIPSNSSQSYNFYGGSSKRLTITNDGEVGINVASPLAALDVNVDQGTTDSRIMLDHGATSADPTIKMYRWTGTGDNYYPYYISNISGDLAFQSGTDTLIGSETVTTKMLLTAAGNVGIGVTAPVQKLDIFGNINLNTITKPTAPTVAVSAGGSVNDGNHYYKITYVNAYGETELGTISAVATCGGGNNTVNLTNVPVSTQQGVTSRKIYRTKAGGSSYYYVNVIADNSTTTYDDSVADGSLVAGTHTLRGNTTGGQIYLDGVWAGIITTMPAVGGGSNMSLGVYALDAITSGRFNVAYGYQAGTMVDTGVGNVAIGHGALATATSAGNNMALGYNSLNLATGGYNVGVGSSAGSTISSGTYNLCIGFGAGLGTSTGLTTGSNNIVIGSNAGGAVGNGGYNTFIGDGAARITSSSNNVYVGALTGFTATTGSDNIFLGYKSGYYETGSSKLFIDNQSRTNEATSRTSSMLYGVFNATVLSQTLTANGRFGINNVPTAILDVDSLTDAGNIVDIKDGGTSILTIADGGNIIMNETGLATSDLRVEGDTDANLLFTDASADSVGVGTNTPGYKFQVKIDSSNEGHVDATGAWARSSDARLKTNVTNLENSLNSLLQLRSVRYDSIGDIDIVTGEGAKIGFIAQEVETLFPEFVGTDKNGYKSIAYESFVPVIVKGIQEQQKQLSGYGSSINTLNSTTTGLESLIKNSNSEIFSSTQDLNISEVVSLKSNAKNEIIKSELDDDPAIIGVVTEILSDSQYRVTYTGRVKAKVSVSKGEILSGSLLTTSKETPGTAVKSTDGSKGTLGVALDLTNQDSEIEILVRPNYTPPAISTGGLTPEQSAALAMLNIASDGHLVINGNLEVKGSLKLGNDSRGIDLAVTEGVTFVEVPFNKIRDNNKYAVTVLPSWLTNVAVTQKLNDKFRVEFSSPAPISAKVDWIIIE